MVNHERIGEFNFKRKRHQMHRHMYFFLIALLASTGCSTHSIFLLKDKTTFTPIGDQKYPAHTNRVFISHETMPSTMKAQVLGQVDAGTVMYNAFHIVYCRMAQKARDVGADAIFDANVWYQACGWANATPHGKGTAIKLMDGETPDFSSMKGDWF